MWRGLLSSTRYFAMSSSDKPRPNQVRYQVRNGTMMKRLATIISQMLDGRRGFGAVITSPVPPLRFMNSFSTGTFNHRGHRGSTNETTEGKRRLGTPREMLARGPRFALPAH